MVHTENSPCHSHLSSRQFLLCACLPKVNTEKLLSCCILPEFPYVYIYVDMNREFLYILRFISIFKKIFNVVSLRLFRMSSQSTQSF